MHVWRLGERIVIYMGFVGVRLKSAGLDRRRKGETRNVCNCTEKAGSLGCLAGGLLQSSTDGWTYDEENVLILRHVLKSLYDSSASYSRLAYISTDS